jgi:hypothetical protein
MRYDSFKSNYWHCDDLNVYFQIKLFSNIADIQFDAYDAFLE